MRKSVSIYGGSGYAGAELLRILGGHSGVRVVDVFGGGSAGSSIASVLPWLAGRLSGLPTHFKSSSEPASGEIAFLALPSAESASLAPRLLDEGIRVIDLSGAFRISDQKEYAHFYHESPASLSSTKAVYGLSEWNRPEIAASRLTANPGCYATSTILALAPLLKERLLTGEGIVINSMSGVSGAGRRADAALNFAECNENVKAYRVSDHQHIPEIRESLHAISGVSPSFNFIPHLIPISRGIYTTIVAPLAVGASLPDVSRAFEKYYSHAPFVAASANEVPELRSVQHTNMAKIGVQICPSTGNLLLFSVLDNLQKGAAGQAVQNMNIMYGFEEEFGLW